VKPSTQSLRIIVTGIMAQHPRLGGMTWHYLQYLIGLSALGCDVYYFEDSGLYPYDITGRLRGSKGVVESRKANVAQLEAVLARYGLQDRWAYFCAPEATWFGLAERQRSEIIDSADLLINVSGSLEMPDKYRVIPRLAYIDTDPVVSQIKYRLAEPPEFPGRVDAHDIHFSFGEIDSPLVPETGHRWLPTRQPVCLDEWKPATTDGIAYTTVMSWTSYSPLRWEGRQYSQKDAEFQRYLGLASRVAPIRLEVAMTPMQHPYWQSPLDALDPELAELLESRPDWQPHDLLTATGWAVVNANELCSTIDDYRNYIRGARGEWSVAKNAYVTGRPGWFSERSACFLAAGRPVIVQDTGFSDILPVGDGLIAFSTPDEAEAGIFEAEARYRHHARNARALAEQYFDAARVLPDLIERAMATS